MLKDLTLLYVEDDKDMQKYMKLVLANKVKSFYSAIDGSQGLSVFKDKRPDIVITDIYMPYLDGFEMSKEIKAIDKDVAILMNSAFDDKESLMKAINIGIDYFIPKPIDIEELLERLEMIAQDIAHKKSKNNEFNNLKKLAYYDSLTGLLNRVAFEDKLELYIQNNREFSLFFIDLDGFKAVNDNFGHKVGDGVLKFVADQIEKVVQNQIAARISGDEFAIIIDEIDRTKLSNIANKIIKQIHQPIKIDGVTTKVGCSIGISIFPQDTTNKKDLIHYADIAMYEAKRAGKLTYRFFSDI